MRSGEPPAAESAQNRTWDKFDETIFWFLSPSDSSFMPQIGKKDQFYKHFIKYSPGQKPVPAAKTVQRNQSSNRIVRRTAVLFLLPASPLLRWHN